MSKIALVHVNGKARTIRHGEGGTALATDGGLNYLWLEDVPAGTKVTVEPDPTAVPAEVKPAAKVPAKGHKAPAPATPEVVAPVEDTPATRAHPSTVATSIAAVKEPVVPGKPGKVAATPPALSANVARGLAGTEVKTDWSHSPGGGPKKG